MGFWRRVGEFFFTLHHGPTATFDTAPRPVDAVIAEMLGRGTAPRVGRTEALSVPAVQRGRNLICSISTLPLIQRGPDRRVVPNPLLDQLDPNVANVVTLAQTLEDLLFESVAWWQILAFGWDGYPASAQHLDVSTVTTDPPKDRPVSPLPSGMDPRDGVVWVDGKPLSGKEIIRFDSPNPALLKVGGRAIKRAILLDQAARMYADDPRPMDYFTPAEGADPIDDDDVKVELAKWSAQRKKRGTAYVPAALKYNTVDAPSPADLQLVELQKQAGLDIANALGVDPEELGISTTSRTYTNAVDRRRDRINDTLSPYMRAITDRLSMPDVTKRGYKVVFDLDDYMRADPLTRAQVYQVYLDMGATTVDEIREEEGLPPLPAGATDVAPKPAPEPEPMVPVDASALAAMTFDGPAMQFADVPVTGFSVDRDARIIEGLILPYGDVGTKFGLRFRFSKGALQWSDPTRVKLNTHHEVRETVGYAEKLTSVSDGVHARFKVARGPEGDRALELAEDKVLDGLSVGVDFDMAADTTPDPRDKTGVLVRRADLRHVALTPEPSFGNARVTRVAASRTAEGDPVTETTAETTSAPAVPAVVPAPAQTFSMDQVLQLLAQARQQPLGIAPAPEQRQTVNPVRATTQTFVAEAAPYRLDRRGNIHRGSHDFSADLIAALRDGDVAAHERAMSFVQAQFDVITTDVNELNPTRNRPDMYVDQRDFRYPVWDAINKGTLTDITPFTFPKFNSAGSLVGAHTEGTEPSSGTFTVTNATVTPVALSGKAKISRETWDQGGNPQISNLIWRQMQKGWFEALEAAAVAVLDAATPTGISLTAGGGTTGQTLDQELTAAFAALQFVRGGFSMDNMFTQIDLYKALVAAADDTGRRLYPALGPTNASGSVRARFGALDVNGVVALPAWALAATGSVVASSYLFDSEAVHGWASAPQRLTIDQTEVANVYIGIWGYRATVISDINGVREITYDPVP